MKRARVIVMILIAIIFAVFAGCGVLLINNIGKGFNSLADLIVLAPSRKQDESKASIFAEVTDNRDALIEEMNTVESWSEEYYLLYKDADWVKGHEVEYPYNREFVLDDDVNLFFAENSLVDTISYPVNSDIIVFETDGVGNVTASVTMGFYYSPQDKPAWINSEQLIIFPLETGKYMDYPMIQDGDGWVPDTSVLDPEDEMDRLLRSYNLYTERICENFFYYESYL